MGFLIPQFSDIVDILIIAYLIYQGLLMLGKKSNYQVLYIILAAFLAYWLSIVLNLKMVSQLLNSIKSHWLLILIIIFQSDIREFLNKLSLISQDLTKSRVKTSGDFTSSLIDAISAMSFRRIGAIIVIEKKRNLDDFIKAGEILDAQLSLRLILSIFNTKSVLHDGAIVISNDRITAAKVVLPLSQNQEYKKIFGTRHLAAIGISELSDALAIVVSEQTGKVSIARNGTIQADVPFEELMQIITDAAK
jgi:diadenylate cyclase